MPFLDRTNAQLYYEDSGKGTPIIALHGLSLNSAYWNKSGFTEKISPFFRFIKLDMRGHGRTRVDPTTPGYDVDTMIGDITALADQLDLPQFHLMGHSTGGMIAVRYGMYFSERLTSLILMNTSSATALIPGDETTRKTWMEAFATTFDKNSWDKIIAMSRLMPGPLLATMNQHPQHQLLWQRLEEIFKVGNPANIAAFIRSFYTDSNPQVEKLKTIQCPTLILTGAEDTVFKASSQLMAQHIPHNHQVILPSVGHMTALEDLNATAKAVLSFLQSI